MNASPKPPTEALASLGSLDDNPKCKVKVRILSPTNLPGFYHCVTEHGLELTIHKHKLEPQPIP